MPGIKAAIRISIAKIPVDFYRIAGVGLRRKHEGVYSTTVFDI